MLDHLAGLSGGPVEPGFNVRQGVKEMNTKQGEFTNEHKPNDLDNSQPASLNMGPCVASCSSIGPDAA
jgi:hypothetical protein